jgi:hypothetical protein
VPEKGVGKVHLFLRKLEWALIGILAPEVILFNAWSQWRSAKNLLAKFEEEIKKVRISTGRPTT